MEDYTVIGINLKLCACCGDIYAVPLENTVISPTTPRESRDEYRRRVLGGMLPKEMRTWEVK